MKLRHHRAGIATASAITSVATAVLISACGGTSTTSQGPNPAGSSAAAANPSSAAYKMGLKAGTKGFAEVEAFKGKSYQAACKASFDLDSVGSSDLNQQDYMAGCLYGLSHQSAQWTQTRK